MNIPIRRVIYSNGNGWLEQVLSCIGLSSLVEEYENYFNPNTFNRGYTNDNDSFNPELGMMKLCNKIKSEKEHLNEFLNEIFRRLDEIEDSSHLKQIQNCLELLGYALQIENTDMGDRYSLQYLSSGEVERQSDMSVMRQELNLGYPEVLRHYNEALETYSNGNFKSCIDNCRTAFEKILTKLDTENGDYLRGILVATDERITQDGAELKSKKRIFKYWLDNNKGANRYRIMATLYSGMSGLGAHGEDNPSQEDALMILRMTEDVFLWLIQKSRI
ncbi:hypothetical protein H9655_18585 [Cytobacillus sp. Sa5YUA1]|uniref:Abortive infection Abi-like protein n=1 Tax=Cytobacillus stercorigallinarum TaxID=2762240 RepID=A0ABR8QU38_9BACI|nr:hypothetical protein [Cytobacillus stercorigallinarum]MBD7939049.1 hypothetical protein [Cytobacillus stercorigallinarum]